VMYRDPDKAGLKIIVFLSDFPLPGYAWQLNRFRADVNALRRVKMDTEAEPLAFCHTTLAELTVSTFNLVRSFSFVGDPSYTTDGQTEEPLPAEAPPNDSKEDADASGA